MKKHSRLLTRIFFLLSILFLGLLAILAGYFINDYINLISSDNLSGIDYLLFGFFYIIGFLPVSVLGLVSSVLSIKFTTSKKIKVFSYIEIVVFILGIVFSAVLYFV